MLMTTATRLFSLAWMLSMRWQLHGLVLCITSVIVDGAMLSAPRNLTLVHPLLSREVKIKWSPGNANDRLTDYIIVNRVEGSDTKTVTRIDSVYTSFTLKDLKPDTSYVIYVQAAIGNERSVSSSTVEYKTSRTEGLRRTFNTSGAELVILFMVMALWFGALSLFLRTWRKKMNGHVPQKPSGTGSPLRVRSRCRRPWTWSQKHRTERSYPLT